MQALVGEGQSSRPAEAPTISMDWDREDQPGDCGRVGPAGARCADSWSRRGSGLRNASYNRGSSAPKRRRPRGFGQTVELASFDKRLLAAAGALDIPQYER
jgi:hypothetical protein